MVRLDFGVLHEVATLTPNNCRSDRRLETCGTTEGTVRVVVVVDKEGMTDEVILFQHFGQKSKGELFALHLQRQIQLYCSAVHQVDIFLCWLH